MISMSNHTGAYWIERIFVDNYNYTWQGTTAWLHWILSTMHQEYSTSCSSHSSPSSCQVRVGAEMKWSMRLPHLDVWGAFSLHFIFTLNLQPQLITLDHPPAFNSRSSFSALIGSEVDSVGQKISSYSKKTNCWCDFFQNCDWQLCINMDFFSKERQLPQVRSSQSVIYFCFEVSCVSCFILYQRREYYKNTGIIVSVLIPYMILPRIAEARLLLRELVLLEWRFVGIFQWKKQKSKFTFTYFTFSSLDWAFFEWDLPQFFLRLR